MSAELPIANIDMDGVVAGFDQRVDEIAKQRFDLDPPRFRTHFYSSKNYPCEYSEALREASNEERFFASLPLLDGAIHGIGRVVEAGYHPRFLSSPIRSNPHSKKEKLEWLEEHIVPHFGSFIVAQAIITSNKHLHDGAVLIDDRPEIKYSNYATWQHVLFTQDYNKRAVSKFRISDWYDPDLEDTLYEATAKAKKS